MTELTLRPVTPDDLDELYRHQADPVAAEMAAFPSRDRAAFVEHWTTRVFVSPSNYARAVIVDGAVAGNVVSWIDADSGHRFLGYWLGREFWGRGIATEAVRLALGEIGERPVFADVAVHNVGSQRVLERTGFRRTSDEPTVHGDGVALFLYQLD